MVQDDTKTRLMDAAEQQVRQKGADGFSYADLSKQIGIRKASIHYHFPAKSDLLTAIMSRYSEHLLTTMESYSQELPTAARRLAAFVDLYRDALQDGTTLCLCVAYAVSQEGLSSDTRDEISRFREAVVAWLRRTFIEAKSDGTVRNLGEPDSEAAAAIALVEGAQISARIGGNPALFDVATDALRKRLT